MLNLLFLYIAILINLFCGFYLISISKCKSLGMQTLYDSILNYGTRCTMVFFTFTGLVCTLATFCVLNKIVASAIIIVWDIISVYTCFAIASISIIRYLLVFHGALFDSVLDKKVMKYVKFTNMILTLKLLGIDFVLYYDFEASGVYASLIGNKQVSK